MSLINIDTAIAANLTWAEMALLNISITKDEQSDESLNENDNSKIDFYSFDLINSCNIKSTNKA